MPLQKDFYLRFTLNLYEIDLGSELLNINAYHSINNIMINRYPVHKYQSKLKNLVMKINQDLLL